MIKEQFIKLMGNIDDDIIESYLGTPVDEGRPITVHANSSRSSFLKFLGVAAAVVCAAAAAIFMAIRSQLPNTPANIIESSDDSSESSIPVQSGQENSTGDVSSADDSQKETIEKLMREYDRGRTEAPSITEAAYYNGYDLTFYDENGQREREVHVPAPNSIYNVAHNYSLRNDAVVIAYNSEDSPNAVTFLVTKDKGDSWQTSELAVDHPDGIYNIAFRNAKEGIFLLRDRVADSGMGRGDIIIYTTNDTAKTWKQAGRLSGEYGFISITTVGDSYWICGEKNSYPAILHSDDGVNWKESRVSIDKEKYANGYYGQSKVCFSDNIGVSYLIGRTPNKDIVHMWYVSEDCGETWSYYKTEKIFYNTSDSISGDTSQSTSLNIGSGMTLTGTMLDAAQWENFSIKTYPGSIYYTQADEEFLESIDIPEIKLLYKACGSLYGLMNTQNFTPGCAATWNGKEPARITIGSSGDMPDGLIHTYTEWGYTYHSFYSEYLSAFTQDAADEIFNGRHKIFINGLGALFCASGIDADNTWTGETANEVRREYQLLSKSDDTVEFRRITFSDSSGKFNGEYLPDHLGEYFIQQTDFKFVKTESGWRAASLPHPIQVTL